ncbi:MAG: hypothetical protein WBV22_05670 [Anaerolineaceae bacterium]
MKLTPPKQITFWIAIILGVLGILGTLVTIPVVTGLAFWFVVAGLALLVVALLVKGL